MKFMLIVKASDASEAGEMPPVELLVAMQKFNEEMLGAGILLAGEGLAASAKGARVVFSGDKRSVIDGPFAETKELIAGFWMIQVKSREEAIEWARRAPNPMPVGESVIEVRQVMSADDFEPSLSKSPEGRAAMAGEKEMRKQIEM